MHPLESLPRDLSVPFPHAGEVKMGHETVVMGITTVVGGGTTIATGGVVLAAPLVSTAILSCRTLSCARRDWRRDAFALAERVVFEEAMVGVDETVGAMHASPMAAWVLGPTAP